MVDNQDTSPKFDPRGEMGPFMRLIKPELEEAASRLGELIANEKSIIGPLRKDLDTSILKLVGTGVRAGGGLIQLKQEWFKTYSTYLLANEIVDSLFSGIANAIKEPWKPGEPGEIDYMEFRGEFDRRLRGLNCDVIQDKRNDTYHFVHCIHAPKPPKPPKKKKGESEDTSKQVNYGRCSRFHAELMGRRPAECCVGVFKYHDEKARFEQPGSLERAIKEAGPKVADEFMDWLTGLSQGQRWEIKPWLDSIERGEHLEVIHRMLMKHQAEFNQLCQGSTFHTDDMDKLKEKQWEEMRTWIQGSIPRKSAKFFTIESAQRYWEKVKHYFKAHNQEVTQAVGYLNGHAEELLERMKRARERAQRKRDEYFGSKA